MGHFLLSMVTLWNATWLHHRAGEPAGLRRATVGRVSRNWVRGVTALAAAVVLAGTVVTASGPHAGDEQVDRLGPALPDVARIHGIAAAVLLAALGYTLVRLHRDDAPRGLRVDLQLLLFALLVQAAVGYVQYFAGVPVGLVELHVAGAIAVWVLAVRASLLLHTRTRDAGEPAASGEPQVALARA
jgi:cytochrome c oxidase assembly protein subunit 15